MSRKKASNDRQSSQTPMPAPPYLGYFVAFGLMHLCIIMAHVVYVFERLVCVVCPCLSELCFEEHDRLQYFPRPLSK